MTDTLHALVERFGLLAVFIGCLAEGESAAILAGFFTHQGLFAVASAFLATFLGAFLADAAIFIGGRRFATQPKIRAITARPGFDRALKLVARHPTAYVLLNRYVYGFRLVGGIAAGLSTIPVPKFLLLNAISSLIWSCLFLSIGYVFGAGAQQALGGELAKHERLLVGLAIAVAVTLVTGAAAHFLGRRKRPR